MTCAGLGLELLEALASKDVARQRELQDRLKYSQCDPLWAETLLDYARDLAPGDVAKMDDPVRPLAREPTAC